MPVQFWLLPPKVRKMNKHLGERGTPRSNWWNSSDCHADHIVAAERPLRGDKLNPGIYPKVHFRIRAQTGTLASWLASLLLPVMPPGLSRPRRVANVHSASPVVRKSGPTVRYTPTPKQV